MDIYELFCMIGNDYASIIAEKYNLDPIDLNTHPHFTIQVDDDIIDVRGGVFNITTFNRTKRVSEHLRILNGLGEIATYVKFTYGDDTILVDHIRCVRSGQNFILGANGIKLHNVSPELMADTCFTWPYPFLEPDYEKAIRAMANKGSFIPEHVYSNCADGIKAENIAEAIEVLREEIDCALTGETR